MIDRIRPFVADHVALVVTGVTTLLFVLQITYLAKSDPTVALSIVASTAPGTLLLGLSVSLFPAAVLFVVSVLAGWWTLGIAQGQPLVSPAWFVPVVGIVALVVVPVSSLVGFAIFLGVFLAMSYGVRRRSARAGEAGEAATKPIVEVGPYGRNLFLMFYAAFLLYLVLTSAPWATERVQIAGADPAVAYVLDSDGDWFTMLTVKDRSILHVKASRVILREVCVLSRSRGLLGLGAPLFQLLYPTPLSQCADTTHEP